MNKLFPELEPEFDISNNKKYKVEIIKDNIVYVKKTEEHLPGLYYLVFQKSYSKKENIWEPSFAVMHFWKMISTFHKDYPEKLTAIFSFLNSAPLMAKLLVKPVKLSAKEKQGRLSGSTKQVK